jgi:hypothetical protein
MQQTGYEFSPNCKGNAGSFREKAQWKAKDNSLIGEAESETTLNNLEKSDIADDFFEDQIQPDVPKQTDHHHSILLHRSPLHLRINRLHTLRIHQRRHTCLQYQPHQIRFSDGKFTERLQHVVGMHQSTNSVLHVWAIGETFS